ncbi:hypothetical protein, partial [Caballeronia sp. M23-90]
WARFFDGVETSKKHTATVSARIKCTPLKFLFMRVAPKRVGRFPKKLTFTLASPEAVVNIQIAPRGDEAV